MARVAINTGSIANDGTGDTLRAAGGIINSNFSDIYNYFGDGTNLNFSGGNWEVTAVGINTLSSVGIGTTNPRFDLEVGAVGASGTSLWVNGNARVTGILTVGTASIILDGTSNTISVGSGVTINGDTGIIDATSIVVGGTTITGAGVTRIEAGSGISVDQNTGQVTITATGGGGESYWSQNATGINTTSNVGIGTTTASNALTVKGNTSLETLSVSGVSTLSSNVSVGGTISVDGGVTLATNNATIVGTSGTAGEIKQIAGSPFYYDGSAWREFVLSSGTPVTEPADTEWDNVILRSTYDTNFYDSKFDVHPVLTGAGATNVSSPVKIGTKSYRNNGSAGAGISFAYRSEYDFTGPWTIEFWIYHDSVPTYHTMVSQLSTDDTSNNWAFTISLIGSNVYWQWSNEAETGNKTLYLASTSNFNTGFLGQWKHYALVREPDDGSIHFYIDGIETSYTAGGSLIDNNITSTNGAGLYIGGVETEDINSYTFNSTSSIDAFFDDIRISTVARYTSVGITTDITFTPPTTALPTSGTLSSVVNPPGDKYGEITLGGSPTWRGTSGVTVSQQSSGNYRVSFASTYTNANDYFVLSHPMDQGFASYVGIARSTSHVDFSINKQSDDSAVDTGSLAVQIKNHP